MIRPCLSCVTHLNLIAIPRLLLTVGDAEAILAWKDDTVQVLTTKHSTSSRAYVLFGYACLPSGCSRMRAPLTAVSCGQAGARCPQTSLALLALCSLCSEEDRIRATAGGFLNEASRVQGVLATCRSLGDFRLYPYVSCLPAVKKVEVDDSANFIILAWCVA